MTKTPTITRATIGTSASQPITAALECLRGVEIYNGGSATIYLGFSNSVTTSNGHPIPAGNSFFVECGMLDDLNEDDIWLISGSAGQAVSLYRN